MINGQLFTTEFVLHGITELPVWQLLDTSPAFLTFRSGLKAHYSALAWASALNEEQTEDALIAPVLDLLGWENCTIAQINLPVQDMPDYLLFETSAAKALARELKDADRAKFAIALLEAKRWTRPLDRADEAHIPTRKRLDYSAPSSQMLGYLARADVMSERKLKWGVLTNGVLFRLYYQDARSRSEDFFEVDLSLVFDLPGAPEPPERFVEAEHLLKLFYLLFGRAGFAPQSWDVAGRTLHVIGLHESQLYEAKVAAELSELVVNVLFPSLASAIAMTDVNGGQDLAASMDTDAPYLRRGFYSRAYLDELREGTLVLLYRLLFVFYAEDRRLLALDRRFKNYSASDLRARIALELDQGVVQAKNVARHWQHLNNLFALIAMGDDDVGMPAYNGGLFQPDRAPILVRAHVGDRFLAAALDALSRRTHVPTKPRINYSDLSVARLGSIYARLLETVLVQDDERQFTTMPASFARKASGSDYTHDELVSLVIDQSIGRLIRAKYEPFDAALTKLTQKTPHAQDLEKLVKLDPAAEILELGICDPAMGSGQFLLALVDYLTDQILAATHHAQQQVNEQICAALISAGRPGLAKQGVFNPWMSPVLIKVADIRQRVLKEASERGWSMRENQLDDRQIVRRMILKKMLFGVDKNPMAVELAKLTLWLHTFTVGAPLSFLDHHLKCGDSLHGEKLAQVGRDLSSIGVLFQTAELEHLALAAVHLQNVAGLTDTSLAEVHESKRLSEAADAQLKPVLNLLSFWRALRWLIPGWPTVKLAKITDESVRLGLAELFSGRIDLTAALNAPTLGELAGELAGDSAAIKAANNLLSQTRAIAKREQFFHWTAAFPTVWTHPKRGFDAVIGNPPWDRMKLQESAWFAERAPKIAQQTRAADRKALIDEELKYQTALAQDYRRAAESRDISMRVLRESGEYPLLAGDLHLYSLFVERAQALVHRRGMVGLLIPSGIAADKNASELFRSLSNTGRLAALFDFENKALENKSFENKKNFFPDLDPHFKFCALIFGAPAWKFPHADCAFFLHRGDDILAPGQVLKLTPKDFIRINPNTGAAPFFRTPRDAEITLKIYRKHPVLVNRSSGVEERVWPVRYATMFHMTHDSKLFLTEAALKKQGFKPAAMNRWKKGKVQALPLYEGKMLHLYDHRAADLAQPEGLADAEKVNPARFSAPEFRVIDDEDKSLIKYALTFKDATSATHARTMIAAIAPTSALGNTLPKIAVETIKDLPLLLANLCCFAYDYCARQKIQGQHLSWFIVEQLPLIPAARLQTCMGTTVIADYIRHEVLALSYTAHDLAEFAIDMGYVDQNGQVLPPYVFDPDDRAHRMARLDALFFELYGLSAKEIKYVLSNFPIVREKDEKQFGSFRTQDLILSYFKRLRSGQLLHDVL